jgi:cell wall assembly regulator SMI1
MSTFEWSQLLSELSVSLIENGGNLPISAAAQQSRWLGYPPAQPADIADAEARLGRPLPPSLRDFYLISNGWGPFGCFIWNLLPVQSIDWVRVREPWLYDSACDAEATAGPWADDPNGLRLQTYRYDQGTQVKRSLVVTSDGDASTWLLDPETLSTTGEWAAGRWSSWNPAMEWISDSFLALVRTEYSDFLRLRNVGA